MRVNISYSVDLEEIPESVGKLLKQVELDYSRLNTKFASIITCLSSDEVHNATLKIDEMRKELFKIDARMMDCVSILDGYQQTLMQLREPNQETSDGKG